jgi:ATP-dependent helicase HrpA
LIDEIHDIESKLRRPDFLVEEDVLYEFYQARIPEHIYSQPVFEKWVKKTEQQAPETIDALKLTRDFLLKQSVDAGLAVEYPDQVQIKNQLELDVDYHFEPGKQQDGLVVKVPLSALNLVQKSDFDWLTPGLLKEKTAFYIKALPKQLRKQFIPAPQTAEVVLQEMSPTKKLDGQSADYVTQLVWALNRRGQQKVSSADFENAGLPEVLPEHLQPYFVLQDDKGKTIAEKADLEALKTEYQHLVDDRIQKHQAKTATDSQRVEEWNFGDLAPSQTIRAKGVEMVAYPALRCRPEAEGDIIELDLVGDEETALAEHGEAVLALLALNLPDKVKYLQKKLPMQKACLCYAPYGTCEALTQQVIDRALRQLVPEPETIRTQAAYEQTLETVRSKWIETAQGIAKQVNDILTGHQKIAKQVKGKVNPRWLASVADIRAQLDALIDKDFVRTTPETWFRQMPRYLQGLEKRLEKIDIDPTKDQKAIREMQPVLEVYERLAQDAAYRNHPGLAEMRWLLEELRLSLFAQPMKTVKPVSVQRLLKQLKTL